MGQELCYNKAILYKTVCLIPLMAEHWCCKYCFGEVKAQNTWLWFGKDYVLADPMPCFRYLVFCHIHVMWQRFDPYWQTFTDWNHQKYLIRNIYSCCHKQSWKMLFHVYCHTPASPHLTWDSAHTQSHVCWKQSNTFCTVLLCCPAVICSCVTPIVVLSTFITEGACFTTS